MGCESVTHHPSHKPTRQAQKKQFTFPSHSQSNNGYKGRFMPPSKFFVKQSINTLAHVTIWFYKGCLLGLAHGSTDVSLIYRRVRTGLAWIHLAPNWEKCGGNTASFQEGSSAQPGKDRTTVRVFLCTRSCCARVADQPAFTSTEGNAQQARFFPQNRIWFKHWEKSNLIRNREDVRPPSLQVFYQQIR